MSRYTGPRIKKLRALGVSLPGLTRKAPANRKFPPGEHGANRRKKLSDHGKQLMEKQKLRLNYGLGETQMRRLIVDARRSKGNTAEKVAELLERRLDNAVFRAGYAPTIPAARQLVTHGHFLVNGRRVNIPSFRVDVGDVIRPRDRSLQLRSIADTLQAMSLTRPEWIEFDTSKLTARISARPDRSSVPVEVEMQLVVEYYAKRL